MHSAYFNNPNNYYPDGQMDWCAGYCKTNWPEDTAHILRIADDAAEQTFLFDLKWDMERTYEPVHFDGEVIWDYMPADDPEFIYQFNRHQFFICLGQAYALTKEERYAEAFALLLHSWIGKNPLNEQTKNTTWRSIEAGIRGETWIKAMAYFKDSPQITDALLEEFTGCLKVHANYLIGSYGYFQVKSNWGVIESRGLLEIGLALKDEPESPLWVETALKRLDEGFCIQIMDDGVQWEQSPMYHNEVFHCGIEVMRLAKRYGLALSQDFTERMRRMAHANLAWKKPNHCQIAQGDSDETDLRDLLAQSAYLMQDQELKFGAYPVLDFDGVWDYTEEGVRSYDALEAKEPGYLVKGLWDSGNLYLRSGWDEEADFFHFRCGSLGGGHGHSDKLHIDLSVCGEDVLVDSGRYHYVGGPVRYLLKNAAAHNTPMIDGRDYLTCLDAWGVEGTAPAFRQSWKQKEGFTYVQGGHGGYLQEGMGGVYINRKVLAIGTGLYIIADEFYGTGEHTFQQRYHFHPEGKAQLAGDGLSAHYTGQGIEADLIFGCGEGTGASLEECKISRNYNQMETGQALTVFRKKQGFCCLISVIAGGKKGGYVRPEVSFLPVSAPARGIILTEEDAHGVRIRWQGKTYVVLIGHRDIAGANEMLAADGCMGLGSVIIFEDGKSKTGGTVMHY